MRANLTLSATSQRHSGSARRQRGLTLLEMAVVLLIAAFVFGAILKGQELIVSARVRAMIGEHEGMRTAWLGFQDRFRAFPGDYDAADRNIRGVTKNGNGNGLVEVSATTTSPQGVEKEYALVWDHLSKAQFLAARYTYSSGTTLDEVSQLAPRNLYGGFADIAYDSRYGNPTASRPDRHTLKTGNLLPVALLAEMDRKVDDGNAFTGGFQFSTFGWFAPAPSNPGTPGACVDTQGQWQLGTTPAPDNCGAASLL